MKTLFLSHAPHEVHLEFAKSIGAEIKIIPLNWLVKLEKKIRFFGRFYHFLSFIYSFFIPRRDILLVDGGSSLYVAIFFKMRFQKTKIIYLDGDMLFYSHNFKKNSLIKEIQNYFFRKIDGVISVSKQNKEFISKYLKVPIKIVSPYPKEIKKMNIKRKNYGLYVGRLDPDKNIKRIIDFGLQCPYFDKFIILGDGANRNYVEKIASQNKKIIYLGQRKDVAKFYSQSKFLIHIPDYDPHPCTTMEAALCGCYPIISKNIGTRYLFDNIFVVENPENFREINEKIDYIIKNKKTADKLLKNALGKFPTKEKSIQNFQRVFTKIIEKLEVFK